MRLAGYLDGFVPSVDPSILVHASDWLTDERFWPAFLYAFGGSRTAVEAFDVDPADVEAMLDQMHRPDSWPVFRMRLSVDHTLYIVSRNFPDDAGWDYLLVMPESKELVLLAALEGHFRGPGLSWSELVATARDSDERLGQDERLLLLLPAVGDTGVPADARHVVASAVTAVGGRHREDEVARELLAACDRFWGVCDWREYDGVRVCLGEYSTRNPGLSREQLVSLSRAFTTG